MTNVINFIIKNRREIESVQHGSGQIGIGTNVYQPAIVTTMQSKTILFFTYTTEENDESPNKELVTGRLESNTLLRFFTNSNVDDVIDIAWTLVEFKASSSMFVQHLNGVASGATENVAITSVNTARAFPILTWENANTSFTADDFGSAEITSSTNCQLKWGAINNTDYALQIVEYDRWVVTKYTDTMPVGDVLEDVTIPAVTESESFLVSTANSSTGGALGGDEIPRYYFQSSVTVRVNRTTGGKALNIIHYVVETNGKVLTDSSPTESITAGNSTGNFGHTSIDWDFSAYRLQGFMGAGYATNFVNTSIRGEDCCQVITNTNATTALQTRGFASATVVCRASLGVLDFSNS